MKRNVQVLTATAVGLVVAAVAGVLQHHFKAGSFLDELCEVILLPGEIVASPFPDHGTASVEFRAKALTFTFLIYGSVAYLIMSRWRRRPA
jgi:hypothetical protein